MLKNFINFEFKINGNLIVNEKLKINFKNQEQIKNVYSEKWEEFDKVEQKDHVFNFQREWFLKLYGFSDVEDLKFFLYKLIMLLGLGEIMHKKLF